MLLCCDIGYATPSYRPDVDRLNKRQDSEFSTPTFLLIRMLWSMTLRPKLNNYGRFGEVCKNPKHALPFKLTEENSNLLRNVSNYFPIDNVSYITRLYIRFNNWSFKYNTEFWKMSLQYSRIIMHSSHDAYFVVLTVFLNKCTNTAALIIIDSPLLQSLLTSNSYCSLSPKTIHKKRGAQIPGARSPWQLHFVRWRLKCLCSERNLLHVTLLAPWMLIRLTDYGNFFASLHKRTAELVWTANDVKFWSSATWSKIIVNIINFWNSYRYAVNENT